MEKEKNNLNVCSSSSFISGDDCLLSSYLRITHPELATKTDSPLILDNKVQGNKLASVLFKEYVTIPFSKYKEKMVKDTIMQIKNGKKAICNASFMKYNMFASIDILVINDDSTVDFYEVKSSTTSKNIFLKEMAFQSFLLKCCDYQIKSAKLVTVSKEFLKTKSFNIKKNFNIVDVTREVSVLEKEVIVFMDELNYLLFVKKELPSKEITTHCFSPYICPFQDYCMKDLPK